jgi:hypothetical protein
MVLARQRAIKATKQQPRAQGLRPQCMAHREIVAAAEEYLAGHRAELIAEAVAVVDRWQAEGFFGKRAALSVRNVPQIPTLAEHEERHYRCDVVINEEPHAGPPGQNRRIARPVAVENGDKGDNRRRRDQRSDDTLFEPIEGAVGQRLSPHAKTSPLEEGLIGFRTAAA